MGKVDSLTAETDQPTETPVTRGQRWLLLACLTPIFTSLIVYSQTWAFVWDEGFHLLAAQLIAAGKRPYIDFCFPQTPLNAYWNAAAMTLFGESWRVSHAFAALFLCFAVWLVADMLLVEFPHPRWRFGCALAAGALFGLNVVVVQFGPVGQAYAICVMLSVGAYRAALAAATRPRPWFALLAGLLAGASAGSSLLTAPVPLVLLIWLFICGTAVNRWFRIAAFVVGCAIPFTPVIWLFIQGPRQTIFNIVQYQALFRRTNWGDARLHDIDALSSWITSPHSLLLAALSIAGVLYLIKAKAEWPRQRLEFLLAVWLALALALFAATAHPTFERYFIFVVPFLSIVSAAGLYIVGSRLGNKERPVLPAAILITLLVAAWGRNLFDEREEERWSDYEEIARKINAVTPMDARLYTDELVYFILRRTPPAGMEFSYSHKLELPKAQEDLLHIVSHKELIQQVKDGQFATFETCRDWVLDNYKPETLFPHHEDVGDCDVFWGKVKSSGHR